MTWMRGARRHWPAAVTDTERDMSRELNTGSGGQREEHGSIYPPDSVRIVMSSATTHIHKHISELSSLFLVFRL